ncbi:hypothetical protein B0H21DRAFT_699790 [Amylocystis lapponica]|nr:hypothetical protein B0H21DRAFT_699790 [Amylocystis lapponica]
MARLRRDTQDTVPVLQRPLRIVASGTLFLTHTLSLPTHPEPSAVVRAQSVTRSRGGTASTCLAILAQFSSVEAMLVASLGGNEEGKMIIRELEKERVSTRFCKIWDDAGVPSAWVLCAGDTDTRAVINNNPLPDITHEDFISLLGPLLAPENYGYMSPVATPASPIIPATTNHAVTNLNALQPRTSISAPLPSPPPPPPPPLPALRANNSPAPFDWVHFEGRSVKTTLSNIMGLDGLARERKWRSHCVFSVDVGRRTRQGVEALIPHADVVFLNRHYARAHSPQYASSPRAFLLSFIALVPAHALLVAHWGAEGGAVLSVPTKEYFQSSGWVEPRLAAGSAVDAPATGLGRAEADVDADADAEQEMRSVRTGSDFWAGHHTDSSSVFTATLLSSPMSSGRARELSADSGGGGGGGGRRPRTAPQAHRRPLRENEHEDGDSSDSDGTQIAGDVGNGHSGRGNGGGADPRANAGQGAGGDAPSDVVDEVGAQDAFVAGMMFALSRRMVPGEPYTPSAVARDGTTVRGADGEKDKGRWRLEECLRFATELAGRKARRRGWNGLAEEMARAGWFDI